jgi:hypothetical protein
MGIQYTPMSKEDLHKIKAGDVLERMLGFQIPVQVVVQEVTEDTIDAGWTFDRHTGLEIDEDIPVKVSYIRSVTKKEDEQILNKIIFRL